MEQKNEIYLDWNLVERIFADEQRKLKRVAYKRNKIYNIKAWIYTILKYKCIERKI